MVVCLHPEAKNTKTMYLLKDTIFYETRNVPFNRDNVQYLFVFKSSSNEG